MAIKNTAKVYIDGILRSSHTVMPLKWGNFLDERLDECHISLRAIKKQIFAPLTPVEIEQTTNCILNAGKQRSCASRPSTTLLQTTSQRKHKSVRGCTTTI